MGIMILVIAFVVEAGLLAYSLITKSDQVRARSLARIGALAAFLGLTLVSVVPWSFRWYGLTALLFALAARGVWVLTRRPAAKMGYRAGARVAKTLTTLLLVGVAVLPALAFPPYASPRVTGIHSVTTAKYTYTDADRIEPFAETGERRAVNVEFWYPVEDGGYPLIVFSHGAFGIKASNTSTFLDLASNGYVVCSIDHPYHAMYTVSADGHLTTADPAFIQEVTGANTGQYTGEEEFTLTQKWLNLRTADLNFVLDTILQNVAAASSGEVYQRIDPGAIGLMGHSLGGAASAQVARTRTDIAAVVNLDADLLGEYLDYQDGRAVLNSALYPVPILSVYSDDMLRVMARGPEAAAAAKHVAGSAPQAHTVHIPGTNHMSLTDLPLVSPLLVAVINNSVNIGGGPETDRRAVIEKMNALVLAFFNAYLKGEGNFSTAGGNKKYPTAPWGPR